ncbi:MAG: hypothetical protein QXU67_03215, partial [Candidatus Bathyarchaeia archaeon]
MAIIRITDDIMTVENAMESPERLLKAPLKVFLSLPFPAILNPREAYRNRYEGRYPSHDEAENCKDGSMLEARRYATGTHLSGYETHEKRL